MTKKKDRRRLFEAHLRQQGFVDASVSSKALSDFVLPVGDRFPQLPGGPAESLKSMVQFAVSVWNAVEAEAMDPKAVSEARWSIVHRGPELLRFFDALVARKRESFADRHLWFAGAEVELADRGGMAILALALAIPEEGGVGALLERMRRQDDGPSASDDGAVDAEA